MKKMHLNLDPHYITINDIPLCRDPQVYLDHRGLRLQCQYATGDAARLAMGNPTGGRSNFKVVPGVCPEVGVKS